MGGAPSRRLKPIRMVNYCGRRALAAIKANKNRDQCSSRPLIPPTIANYCGRRALAATKANKNRDQWPFRPLIPPTIVNYRGRRALAATKPNKNRDRWSFRPLIPPTIEFGAVLLNLKGLSHSLVRLRAICGLTLHGRLSSGDKCPPYAMPSTEPSGFNFTP